MHQVSSRYVQQTLQQVLEALPNRWPFSTTNERLLTLMLTCDNKEHEVSRHHPYMFRSWNKISLQQKGPWAPWLGLLTRTLSCFETTCVYGSAGSNKMPFWTWWRYSCKVEVQTNSSYNLLQLSTNSFACLQLLKNASVRKKTLYHHAFYLTTTACHVSPDTNDRLRVSKH